MHCLKDELRASSIVLYSYKNNTYSSTFFPFCIMAWAQVKYAISVACIKTWLMYLSMQAYCRLYPATVQH